MIHFFALFYKLLAFSSMPLRVQVLGGQQGVLDGVFYEVSF